MLVFLEILLYLLPVARLGERKHKQHAGFLRVEGQRGHEVVLAVVDLTVETSRTGGHTTRAHDVDALGASTEGHVEDVLVEIAITDAGEHDAVEVGIHKRFHWQAGEQLA